MGVDLVLPLELDFVFVFGVPASIVIDEKVFIVLQMVDEWF